MTAIDRHLRLWTVMVDHHHRQTAAARHHRLKVHPVSSRDRTSILTDCFIESWPVRRRNNVLDRTKDVKGRMT